MILDGKKLRDELLISYKEKISKDNLSITLAIILVGDDEASKLYIKNKEKYCSMVGINVIKYLLPKETSEEELISLIKSLNEKEEVTGIILQSPVPSNINFDKCSGLINENKDVDGFTKDNVYNLYLNKKGILPCTVKGIIKLLEYYNIEINGKNVAIIGRGNIVGKPLAMALENRNATVSLLHSKTKDLKMFTKDADIVVVACGIPKLLKKEMIKEGSVVIDVGISRVDGKIVGDIDFDNIKDIALFVTPNPGGIGPMTIAMIIDNLIEMGEVNE